MGVWSDHHMCNKRLRKANFRAVHRAHNYIKESSYDKHIDCILDIGANVGVYALAFAEHFQNAQIHCFEPVLDNFKYLEQHVSKATMYGCEIHLNNFGFWKEERELDMGIPRARADIQNTGLYKIGGEKLIRRASFKVLDPWAKENDVSTQFVKIDAEGADEDIILHGSETIGASDWLLVESSEASIQKLIKSMGFTPRVKCRQDMLWGKNHIRHRGNND